METAEFETDALLKLLTEAIRRGPGSPEWHDAVEQLRSSGSQQADEYRLLMEVRDRLESGRQYREVKAGPGFTRKLFDNLDRPVSARRPTTTILVALVSLVILVGSVSVLINYLSASHSTSPMVEQLALRLFTTSIREWTFIGPIPSELRKAGELKFENNAPLRIDNSGDYKPPARGWVWADQSLNASGGICAEAVVQYKPGNNATVSLMLIDAAGVQADPRGLAIALGDAGFIVEHEGQSTPIAKTLPSGTYTLRLKMDDRVAIAEVDGQTIWSGEHGLPGSVVAGVRFTRAEKSGGDQRVQSFRILAP